MNRLQNNINIKVHIVVFGNKLIVDTEIGTSFCTAGTQYSKVTS